MNALLPEHFKTSVPTSIMRASLPGRCGTTVSMSLFSRTQNRNQDNYLCVGYGEVRFELVGEPPGDTG